MRKSYVEWVKMIVISLNFKISNALKKLNFTIEDHSSLEL